MKRRFIYTRYHYIPPVLVNKIATGHNSTHCIKSNGKAYSWGRNTYGQLGDNSTTQRNTPVSVITTQRFNNIGINSAGYTPMSIKSNGDAYGWGKNDSWQVGDNSPQFNPINRCTPVAVCDNHNFIKVGGGYGHTLAIDSGNTAWGWGYNNYGCLGDNIIYIPVPVRISPTLNLIEISAGQNYSLGIDTDGQGWAWGYNNLGQLGNNSTSTGWQYPIAICGNHTFCRITAAAGHSLAIDIHGQAWAWGYNRFGGLGDNTVTQRLTPVAVCGGHSFVEISAGNDSQYGISAAIDNNGYAWCWGQNGGGNIGDNTTTSRRTPVAVCGGHSFTDIKSGSNYFTIGLDINGKAWAWGYNQYGELGDNTTTQKNTPVAVYTG